MAEMSAETSGRAEEPVVANMARESSGGSSAKRVAASWLYWGYTLSLIHI